MVGIASALMAEWLRRWTRNPMGSAHAGSNPAQCVQDYFFFSPWILSIYMYNIRLPLTEDVEW